MGKTSTRETTPTSGELDEMHALYLRGGRERRMAPHIVDPEASRPHAGCGQAMQAIDFRLEDHGRAVHGPLVRAWWNDTGFVGRCSRCDGWVHFTIRDKRAVTSEEAAKLPRLPDDWFPKATVLSRGDHSLRQYNAVERGTHA